MMIYIKIIIAILALFAPAQRVSACHAVDHCASLHCLRKRRSMQAYTVYELIDDHGHDWREKMYHCVDDYLIAIDTERDHGFIYISIEESQKMLKMNDRQKRFIQQPAASTHLYHNSLMYRFWNMVSWWHRGSEPTLSKKKVKQDRKKHTNKKGRKPKKKENIPNLDGTGLKYSWEYKMFGDLERKYKFLATPRAITVAYRESDPLLDEKVSEMKSIEECYEINKFQIVCYVVRKCAYLLYYDSSPSKY